jgi:hypothetical protein
MLVFVLAFVALTSFTSIIPKTPEGASNKKQYNLVFNVCRHFFPFNFSLGTCIQRTNKIFVRCADTAQNLSKII